MGKDKGAPPYEKINVAALTKMAQDYAREGYAWSDTDWAKRFPEFPAGRDFAIDNANLNLNGGVDPLVSGTLDKTGLGMIDLGGNSFQQSRNLGQPILAKEQRDRNYFQRLFTDPLNQPRGDLAGLSGKNIAEIRAVESGNKINYDWANFGTRINQYGAQTAQANALGQMIGRAAGGIAQTGVSSLANRNTQQTSISPYVTGNAYGQWGVQQGNSFQPYYNPSGLTYNGPGVTEGYIDGNQVRAAIPVEGYNYDAGSSGGGGF